MGLQSAEFGLRDAVNDRLRLAGLLVLLLLLVCMEWVYGPKLDDQYSRQLGDQQHNWATQRYLHPAPAPGSAGVNDDREKILYLSNSHALTGGRVGRHLQVLLERVAPERYEIVDMSSPGMFAPEFLQRAAFGAGLAPRAAVIGSAYISFSDHMKLARQNHSARRFFSNKVRDGLPFGFWLRNYDIGLYSDTFVAEHVRLVRFRNSIRDTWEKPVASALRKISGQRPILFLEIDEHLGWKFPDGYDRNLFQWRLYAAGRSGHIADMRATVAAAQDAGVPVIAYNLPIHWDKSVYEFPLSDYRRFRMELGEVFADATYYEDEEDGFPKAFTTYDALHPTWHGARLHALKVALDLHRVGVLSPHHTPEVLLEAFTAGDAELAAVYKAALDTLPGTVTPGGFRRYEIFEPDNAAELLQRLHKSRLGSREERTLMYFLSLRTRYWREQQFDLPGPGSDPYRVAFNQAADMEIRRARHHARLFEEKMSQIQTRRLQAFPLPRQLRQAKLIKQTNTRVRGGATLTASSLRLADNTPVTTYSLANGKMVAITVGDREQYASYTRIDVLGDDSFALVQSSRLPLLVPTWMEHPKPFVRFGI